MTTQDIHALLKTKFADAIGELKPVAEGSQSNPFIDVVPDKIHTVLKHLKDSEDLFFDNMVCISGVDYKDRFEVVYHYHSYKHLHKIVIKATITDRENPQIDTVSDLWKGANWLEREVYDMIGITFKNHPDLRRILSPDDWEGYPLRKDYKHQEFWHGIQVGM